MSFGWNSDRGAQERSFRWLRKRLKKDYLLLLSDPDAYFREHGHESPFVRLIQEMLQKYIDFEDGEKTGILAVEGPLDRYYIVTTPGRGTTLRAVIIDKERLDRYSVRNLESRKEFSLSLHYGVPVVQLPGEKKPSLVVDFLEDSQKWTIKGPGVVFGAPVVEVTF